MSALKAAWLEYTVQVWELAAEAMKEKCREAAAQHRQTGVMEDSGVVSMFTATEGEVSGSLEFTAPYSSFVDTGRGPVVPVYAKALRFTAGGTTVFAMYASAYEGSEWFTGTVTDGNWAECVAQAAASVSVFA